MERETLKALLASVPNNEPEPTEQFQDALSMIVDKPITTLTNFEMIQLYGLYKQGTEGNLTVDRPLLAEDPVGVAKW